MALGAEPIASAAIVLLQLVLIGVLLGYGGQRRENRALAFVLLMRSGSYALQVVGAVSPSLRSAAQATVPYLDIAYVIGIFYLAVVFLDRSAKSRRSWIALATASLVLLGYEAYYLLDHAAYAARQTPPWQLYRFGTGVSYPTLGLLLLRVAWRERAEAPLLAGTAFVLISFYDRLLVAPGVLSDLQKARWGEGAGATVALALYAAFVVRLVMLSRGAGTFAWLSRRSLVLTLACAASAVVALAVGGDWPVLGAAAWDLALPLLVGYAILRHDLLGLDRRVRWTVQRGTLAFAFVATFFVGTQLAQNWLSARYGIVLGGVAAGLLLFAIAPLQRLAERVATAAVPQAQPAVVADRKLAALRKAAQNAARDGRVSREEEKHLYALAAEMGVDAATAHAIILEVERG